MEHILSFIHTTDTSLYLNKTCPLPIEADIWTNSVPPQRRRRLHISWHFQIAWRRFTWTKRFSNVLRGTDIKLMLIYCSRFWGITPSWVLRMFHCSTLLTKSCISLFENRAKRFSSFLGLSFPLWMISKSANMTYLDLASVKQLMFKVSCRFFYCGIRHQV